MKKLFIESDISQIAESLSDELDYLAGKTIMLAGASGFLGRYFIETFSLLNRTSLAKNPVRIVGLDNLITGDDSYQEKINDHIEIHNHNIIKPFESDIEFDIYVHSASIASPFYYRANPLETLDVAVSGARWMLDQATSHHARFVFFSSSEIYGDPDAKHVPTPESYKGYVSCQGPRACYDESKRLGEALCYIYHQKHGTHTNTIRPFNVFGPGMGEKDYRVMPNFANCIVGGHRLKVYGDGKQTRTFCYVTDAITGMIKVFAKGVPGEAYNIGNPLPEIGMIDLANLMIAASTKDVAYDIIEHPDSYPADEPQRRCPNIEKANIQLKYEPAVEFSDGLSRYLGWAQNHYTGNL